MSSSRRDPNLDALLEVEAARDRVIYQAKLLLDAGTFVRRNDVTTFVIPVELRDRLAAAFLELGEVMDP